MARRSRLVLGLVALVFATSTAVAQGEVLVQARVLGLSTTVRESASDAQVDGRGRVVILAERGVDHSATLILRRRLADGRADSSFGRRGQRIVRAVSSTTKFDTGPLRLWKGRIIAAGGGENPDLHSCWLVRLRSDGRRDRSFGHDGITGVGPKNSLGWPRGMAVLANGSVLLAGMCGEEEVVRFTPAGRLDRRFGVGGAAPSPFPAGTSITAMRRDAEGRILVAGTADSGFLVARLTPSGSLDRTFASGGIATTVFYGQSGHASAILVQPNGKIVVIGWCYAQVADTQDTVQDVCLARYEDTGLLDQSFGTNGTVTSQYRAATSSASGSDQQGYAAALRPNGTIVVGGVVIGATTRGRYQRVVIAEYRPNGRLRRRFANGGWTWFRWKHSWEDWLWAVRVDHRALVAVGNALPIDSYQRIGYARLTTAS